MKVRLQVFFAFVGAYNDTFCPGRQKVSKKRPVRLLRWIPATRFAEFFTSRMYVRITSLTQRHRSSEKFHFDPFLASYENKDVLLSPSSVPVVAAPTLMFNTIINKHLKFPLYTKGHKRILRCVTIYNCETHK